MRFAGSSIPIRQRKVHSVLLLCLLLLVSCGYREAAGDRLRLGAGYPDLASLDRTMTTLGYSRVGRFGETWPARITEIASSLNKLTFSRQGGGRHTYQGFSGYNLVMVRLAGGDGENIVVYRSDRYVNKADPAVPVGTLNGSSGAVGGGMLKLINLAVLFLTVGVMMRLFLRRKSSRSFQGSLASLRQVMKAAKGSSDNGAYLVVELPGGEFLRLAPLLRGFWLNLVPGPARPEGFAERLSNWVEGRDLQFLNEEYGSGIGKDLELRGSTELVAGVIRDLLVEVYGLTGEQPLLYRLFRC